MSNHPRLAAPIYNLCCRYICPHMYNYFQPGVFKNALGKTAMIEGNCCIFFLLYVLFWRRSTLFIYYLWKKYNLLHIKASPVRNKITETEQNTVSVKLIFFLFIWVLFSCICVSVERLLNSFRNFSFPVGTVCPFYGLKSACFTSPSSAEIRSEG